MPFAWSKIADAKVSVPVKQILPVAPKKDKVINGTRIDEHVMRMNNKSGKRVKPVFPITDASPAVVTLPLVPQ